MNSYDRDREIVDGCVDLPQAPGIGFELHDEAWGEFRKLFDDDWR
ncbi:hypothetical protein [Bradyrhizobium sp. ARR65]|nr:hypothetical protein [Bradyrhizobium sp. ARR65]